MAAQHVVSFTVSDVHSPFNSLSACVMVTGSAPQLGNWSPASALVLRLDADGVDWSGEVPVEATSDAGVTLEYKYVMVPVPGSVSEAIWEDGTNRNVSIGPNQRVSVLEAWGNREVTTQVEDIGTGSGEAITDGANEECADVEPAVEAQAEQNPEEVDEPCTSAGEELQEVVGIAAETATANSDAEPVHVAAQDTQDTEMETPAVTVQDTDVAGGEAVTVLDQGHTNGEAEQNCQYASPAAVSADLSLHLPEGNPRAASAGQVQLSVTSERAKMWVFPHNGLPIQEEQSQLFSATQMNFSQMSLEALANGLRPFVVSSLSNPKSHLNFAEGPRSARLRLEAFTQANPDPSTRHPAVLLKYLQKEKAQFLDSTFVFEVHQRLLRAALGVTTLGPMKSGASNGSGVLSPRGPTSPMDPGTPGLFGLPQGLVSPDIDGSADIVEDASILLKHLSQKKEFRNHADIPHGASKSVEHALSNVRQLMKVRDNLDQNSLRLEQLHQEPIEQRRVHAQDILAQCAANLDRDDILEAVIDGLACRVQMQ